jgi:hypothetical protein
LFDSLYKEPEELKFLTDWISDYNVKSFSPTAFMAEKIKHLVLVNLEKELERRSVTSTIDFNLLYLYLGLDAQLAGNQEEMLKYYDKIQLENIFNQLRSKEFDGQVRNQTFRMFGYAMEGYARSGKLDKALRLAGVFKNPINRSSLYAFTAVQLLQNKIKGKPVQQLIDSAEIELTRVENVKTSQPNRRILANALMMLDASKNLTRAKELIKNSFLKFTSIQGICRSFAFYGNLYDARSNIPDFISASDEADFLSFILLGYSEGINKDPISWKSFDERYYSMQTLFILYIDENS